MRGFCLITMILSAIVCGAHAAECPVCECGRTTRDNYAGARVYKNLRGSYSYRQYQASEIDYLDDNVGFGTTVGTNMGGHWRVEYETLYMGTRYSTHGTDFEYNIWANLLNGYFLYDIGDMVAPYVGLGAGVTGIWGEIDNRLDNSVDVSYQVLVGTLIHLNRSIDLDFGFKYVHFGAVEHLHAKTRINAAQLYVGGAYKFRL